MDKNITKTPENEIYAKYVQLARNRVHRALNPLNKEALTRIGFDDLVQEALLATILAIRKFDPSKGNRETTYVVTCMDNAIARYIRENSRAMKINQPQNKMIVAVTKKLQEEDEDGNLLNKSVDDIARELEVNVGDVILAMNAGQYAYSFDYCYEDNNTVDMNSMISKDNELMDLESKEPEADISYDMLKAIRDTDGVSDLEKKMYCNYRGILGNSKMTRKQLMENYNVSKSDIRSFADVAIPIIENNLRESFAYMYRA